MIVYRDTRCPSNMVGRYALEIVQLSEMRNMGEIRATNFLNAVNMEIKVWAILFV